MPKLHIPRQHSDSGTILAPLCGRQLNNNRASRVQAATRVSYATDEREFLEALMSGRACRHCGYTSGRLVRTITVYEREEDSEDE